MRKIWDIAGYFGIIFGGFSLFRIAQSFFEFRLSDIFSKFILFWELYPIQVVKLILSIIYIDISSFSANILILVCLYIGACFRATHWGYFGPMFLSPSARIVGAIQFIVIYPFYLVLVFLLPILKLLRWGIPNQRISSALFGLEIAASDGVKISASIILTLLGFLLFFTLNYAFL